MNDFFNLKERFFVHSEFDHQNIYYRLQWNCSFRIVGNSNNKNDATCLPVISSYNWKIEHLVQIEKRNRIISISCNSSWVEWIFCVGCTNIRSQWLTIFDERNKKHKELFVLNEREETVIRTQWIVALFVVYDFFIFIVCMSDMLPASQPSTFHLH